MTTIIKKYATWVDYTWTTKQRLNNDKYGIKHWDHLENLKTSGQQALCTDKNISKYPIYGVKETYNNPGAIYLAGFGFDFSTGTKIKKLTIHYGHQKYKWKDSQKDYPSIGGATFSLYTSAGTQSDTALTGKAVPITYSKESVTFTNVPLSTVNNSDFGIIINYPQNKNKYWGAIGLGDVYLELEIEGTEISLEATNKTSTIHNGGTFNVNFKVLQTDKNYSDYKPSLLIETSDGITFNKKVSGNGSFNTHTDDKKLYWDSTLDNNKKSEIIGQFKATKEGKATITISDQDLGVTYTLTVTILDYVVTATSNLESLGVNTLKVGKTAKYDVYVSTLSSKEIINLDVYIPTSFELEDDGDTLKSDNNAVITSEQNGTVQHINLDVTLTKGKGSFQLWVTFNASGLYHQLIQYNGELLNTCNVQIKPKSYEHMAYARVLIDDEDVLCAIGDGITYKAFCDTRYVMNTTEEYVIENHYHNLRFGVYNNSIKYVNDEEEFLDHVYWSGMTKNTYKEHFIKFVYNADNPLYFVWTSEYAEDENYSSMNIDFCEPLLIESAYYNKGWEDPALYPTPVDGLLADEAYASATLPFNVETNPVICFDFNDGGLFSQNNTVVQGLRVHWNYITLDEVDVRLTVRVNCTDDAGNKITKEGFRNITLYKGSGDKAIGDEWDLFSLRPHYFRSNFESIELQIELINKNISDIFVELDDFHIDIYTLKVDTTGYGFEIDGERSEEYGIFLTDLPIWDWGTKNDVQYYQTTGTDITTAYRSNVEKKEISLEFQVGDCDLIESAVLLQKITKLFTNERTKYNKPIPKALIFDHLPDYVFWVVREEPIESEINTTNYTGTIKLTVPDGTARSKELIVTGSAGSTTGLASITPYIYASIIKTGDITITEQYTNNSLIINNDSLEIGTKLEIDNTERKIYSYTDTGTNKKDITSLVDWTSTWFSVLGEYNFVSDELNIKQVSFNERI